MAKITLPSSPAEVAFREAGHGPTVLLLHAFPFDLGMWQPQMEALSRRYRLIAPDFPGFGGSAVREGLTIDAAADVVAELLEGLDLLEPVTVAGLSMGGYLALAFARRHPQRLAALVLADTKAEPDDATARSGREKLIELARSAGSAAVMEQLLPKLIGPSSRASQPGLEHSLREQGSRQDPRAIAAALQTLRDRPDARPGLAAISVPTVVVVGAEDAITPPANAQTLVAGIPGARLSVVPNSGHLSNLENPTAFNSIVEEFLDGLPTL